MKMTDEESLLKKMGAQVTSPDAGCCGMAGPFGFDAAKFDVSMAIGERVLLPAVRSAPSDTLILSDGFSCREQIYQGTGSKALHLAEVMQLALGNEERRRKTNKARAAHSTQSRRGAEKLNGSSMTSLGNQSPLRPLDSARPLREHSSFAFGQCRMTETRCQRPFDRLSVDDRRQEHAVAPTTHGNVRARRSRAV